MILLVKIRESNSVKAVKETGYWFSPSTCGWGDFLIADNYRKTTKLVVEIKQTSYTSLNKKVIQQARAEPFCGEWCGGKKLTKKPSKNG